MSVAPIALFCYNRLEVLQKTISALQHNREAAQSHLYLFADGPKNTADQINVELVRSYLPTIKGFAAVEIFAAPANRGLANSIIAGVGHVLQKHDRLIVMEDDLETSPYFLQFMNDALELYADDDRVAGIHGYLPGYNYPGTLPQTFFIREVGCLGWATWRRGWQIFEENGEKLLQKIVDDRRQYEFDVYGSYPYFKMLQNQAAGKVDSWAIRWYASVFVNGKLGLQPGRNLVSHIGYQQGTHFNADSTMQAEQVTLSPVTVAPIEVKCGDALLRNLYAPYYRSLCQNYGHWARIKKYLKKLYSKKQPGFYL